MMKLKIITQISGNLLITMEWLRTITDSLKVDYPVIQAPMLGVSTPEMAAAVSNEGETGYLQAKDVFRNLIEQYKNDRRL